MQPDVNEASDSQLIKAYCNGDEGAFNTLYYRYRKLLYGYLTNMIPGNPCDVDEVFESTWLRVIDKLPKYRDDGKFGAWLFRVARNIFIDRVRMSKPGKFVTIDAEDSPDIAGSTELSPDRVTGSSDLAQVIQKALSQLPDEQREVFLLREQDLSFKEIADMQRCSLNTVLSRMRYALKSLRSFLSEIDRGGLVK